jgi:hypothetical protein
MMPESHNDESRYTEKEVSAILKRAAELQGEGVLATGGTSLAQLQQAAAEIGIDPVKVQQAAAELNTKGQTGPGAAWLGGPWGVDYDKLLPGVIDEDSWPGVVEDLRGETGRVGIPKQVGKGYEWLSLEPDMVHMTFTPSGSNTRVRVMARFGQWGGLLYIMPTLFAMLAAAIVTSALWKHGHITQQMALMILLGAPAAALLAGRAVFGQVAKKKRLQTQQMISRLEATLTATPPQAAEAAHSHSISYTQPQDSSAFTLQASTPRD